MKHFPQMLVSRELGRAAVVALGIANFLRERARETHVCIPGDGPIAKKAVEMGLAHRKYGSVNIITSIVALRENRSC